jgi:site-specific DNA recombinase
LPEIRVGEVDTQLARCRAALDAGADPAVVAGWISDIQARRRQAEGVLHTGNVPRRMTRDEIAELVRNLKDLAVVIARADPTDKADIYRQFGLELTYEPHEKTVTMEADPWRNQSVGGGT